MPSEELDEFTEFINGIEDLDVLKSGVSLVGAMARIISLREEAAKLEEMLYQDEGSLQFAYYADPLDDEDVLAASASIKGRFRHLAEKARKQKLLEKLDKENEPKEI